MTGTTIYRWLTTIPDEWMPELLLGRRTDSNKAHEIRRLAVDQPESDWDAQRFALSYRKPEFGWEFCRLLARHERPLPTFMDGDDQVLFRAYAFLVDPKRFKNQDLSHAMGLRHPDMKTAREVIESMLLTQDATCQSVARAVRMPVGVIKTYEKLFFNVLDRKEDALYMMRIIYPAGRMVEMMSNYLPDLQLGSLLRRVGANDGPEHVLYHAGISNDLVNTLASSSSGKQMEDRIMANGYVMARAGLLNQDPASVPGILHAQRLIAAGKVGGEASDSGSEASAIDCRG